MKSEEDQIISTQTFKPKAVCNLGKCVNEEQEEKIMNQNLENIIADTLGAAVSIKQSASSKKGKIDIQYNDFDELDGILRKIGAKSST